MTVLLLFGCTVPVPGLSTFDARPDLVLSASAGGAATTAGVVGSAMMLRRTTSTIRGPLGLSAAPANASFSGNQRRIFWPAVIMPSPSRRPGRRIRFICRGLVGTPKEPGLPSWLSFVQKDVAIFTMSVSVGCTVPLPGVSILYARPEAVF